MNKYTEIATNIEAEIKIRDYLAKRMGLSSSLIGRVKFGGVRLNGEIVHMRAPVKNGDVIEITLPPEESQSIEPCDIPIEVLYEDDYIIAVNKPRNMPVHPSRGNSLPTLAECVRHHIGAPFVFRAVNLLDRDTSGIVLIAKDAISASRLYRDMKEKHFDKIYIARVCGVPEPACGFIDAPIERIAEGEMKRVVREDGKPSHTEYEVIDIDDAGNATLRVKPLTGRTHQIRVHMAYIGHPLIGDFLYGERIEGETYRLHCSSLSFAHPVTGEKMTVTARMP